MPFTSINPTNPRTNPWNFHKKILRIGDFEKCTFFESAILNFFFQKKIFFLLFFPWKLVKVYWLARMGQKEKESWSSVGGFGMETSNFALNGCLRVSTVRFFDARSNGRLRMSHRALWNWSSTKKHVFWQLFHEISMFYWRFLSKKRNFRPVCIDLSPPIDSAWKTGFLETLDSRLGRKLEVPRRFLTLTEVVRTLPCWLSQFSWKSLKTYLNLHFWTK